MQKRSGHSIMRKTAGSTVAMAALALLAGCSDGGGSGAGSGAGAAAATLPVSIADVKTAMLNKIANPYWMDAWNNTQTEHEWREIEHLAFQVEIGGELLKLAGTGPMDATWVANPDWQQLSEQLSQDGARAVNAARSRNRELMDRAGPQLIETCDACHRAFVPDMQPLSAYRSGLELPDVSR